MCAQHAPLLALLVACCWVWGELGHFCAVPRGHVCGHVCACECMCHAAMVMCMCHAAMVMCMCHADIYVPVSPLHVAAAALSSCGSSCQQWLHCRHVAAAASSRCTVAVPLMAPLLTCPHACYSCCLTRAHTNTHAQLLPPEHCSCCVHPRCTTHHALLPLCHCRLWRRADQL